MEEKTEYRLDERTSDINDMLENCLTRVGIVDQLMFASHPASSISDVFSFIRYTYLRSICNTIIRYYHLIFPSWDKNHLHISDDKDILYE
jgi:hypothetical protein